MYRNVSGPTWSTDDHASRMLALPGVTPPLSVVRSQPPGSSSLLPPLKALSSPVRIGRVGDPARGLGPRPVDVRRRVVWLPSAPWNMLPGSGDWDGGSGTAAACAAPKSVSTDGCKHRETRGVTRGARHGSHASRMRARVRITRNG